MQEYVLYAIAAISSFLMNNLTRRNSKIVNVGALVPIYLIVFPAIFLQ